ncbi:MAG: DUF3267 domain-containing protein [Chloroflexaceae bacterium]|nr:DUF3267 domain-containing protein [Chloroflexaceae bacterium]NJO04814.1 DUF3267 domain-containing protein [Chloroflexaceae bacterium]
MQSTRTLPASYHLHGTLDLSQNRQALIWLNLASIVLVGVFGWLTLQYIAAVRPSLPTVQINLNGWDLLIYIGLLVLAMLGTIVLHELIHGAFFWLYTRAQAVYGFKGIYAYAAAPGWYIPRYQYTITALAPLVCITLAGALLVLVVPAAIIFWVAVVVVANAAGATGDLAITAWLLTQPRGTLVHDTGDAMMIYQPAPSPADSHG